MQRQKSEDIMDRGERVLLVGKDGENALNYMPMRRDISRSEATQRVNAYHQYFQALKKGVLGGTNL
jgi:hypothetical protein